MNKTKLILTGVAIGFNVILLALCVYLGYLWNYKRPIVQEVHTTTQIINGENSTVSQAVDTKKEKDWFAGVYGGYKSVGIIVGRTF